MAEHPARRSKVPAPLHAASAKDSPEPSSGGEPAPLVLIVDDFEDARTTTAAILRHHGFRTCEAEDGEEAVQVAVRSMPAAILMDIGMPRVDGLEAARRLKGDERTRKIPIIVVSAYSLMEYGDRASHAGVHGFLQKPVDLEQLLAAVRRAIRDAGVGG